MRFSLNKKSGNRKTGIMPVSTSPKTTCSPDCPFLDNGCYGDGFPANLHWQQLTLGLRGFDYNEFLETVSSLDDDELWRHNQMGDLLHRNGKILKSKLHALVRANRGKRGFTYTHHRVEGNTKKAKENRDVIAYANNNGFTINLSANSIKHADKLVKLKIAPVTTVVPENQTTNTTTPDGHKVTICPAVINEGIQCADCKLCAIPNRKTIIAFPAHGNRRKSMSKLIQELNK